MFNVCIFEPNSKKFVYYDVMPYLKETYKKEKLKLKTFDEFKEFVIKESRYQFWSRCEYEIVLVDWPCQKIEKKIDIFDQIMMNVDLITKLLMDEIK